MFEVSVEDVTRRERGGAITPGDLRQYDNLLGRWIEMTTAAFLTEIAKGQRAETAAMTIHVPGLAALLAGNGFRTAEDHRRIARRSAVAAASRHHFRRGV